MSRQSKSTRTTRTGKSRVEGETKPMANRSERRSAKFKGEFCRFCGTCFEDDHEKGCAMLNGAVESDF
jgi:hypothetical protein